VATRDSGLRGSGGISPGSEGSPMGAAIGGGSRELSTGIGCADGRAGELNGGGRGLAAGMLSLPAGNGMAVGTCSDEPGGGDAVGGMRGSSCPEGRFSPGLESNGG
jgi:hypothetical protein